jgi:hypothetical protein
MIVRRTEKPRVGGLIPRLATISVLATCPLDSDKARDCASLQRRSVQQQGFFRIHTVRNQITAQ